ncbi:MAG: DUF72 domain-containing protein [Acidobacteria bacterium]|nr:DUF72 domain-containing protein [Acidobacteriota bacterium]
MRNELRIGPAGWSYRDWNGVVYPNRRPPGFHEAEYLASFFSTIEINSSFYRPLRPQLSQVWMKKLERFREFRFTAKLYRAFTHDQRLERREIQEFCEGLEPLIDAGKLGCLLMQFPWSFRRTPENRAHLERLVQAFGQYPLVAEMRHSSWDCDEALDALSRLGVSFCNIDQPQLNHCLGPTAHVTGPIGYVRLHGRNYEDWFRFEEGRLPDGRSGVEARYDYLYSPEQLSKWNARIERITAQAETTYVITNNHFRGQAVVNALQILSEATGERVLTPPSLIEHYPELNQVAGNLPPQRSLFFDQRRAPQHRIPPRRIGVAAVYARA